MVKLIIIDDEITSCEAIKTSVEKHCPNAQISDIVTNPLQARLAIIKHQPDIIFLDVQMPAKNGFELLADIPNRNFEVIFITAYEEFALKAIKAGAADYILKPYTELDIAEAFFKAAAKIADNKQKSTALLENANRQSPTILPVPTVDGIEFIQTNQLVRCEASQSYTWLHFSDNKKMLISKSIGDFEKNLEHAGFHRVHHSHLVNMVYIQKYVHGRGGYIVLKNGQHIEVSVRKKAAFFDQIFNQ